MEFATKGARFESTKIMLLSAEGKNTDILASAKTAAMADISCAAVTLKKNSPLVEYSEQTGSVRTYSYDMPWEKDGYLATNSLIATVILFYKALFGPEETDQLISREFNAGSLRKYRNQWLTCRAILEYPTRPILVLHDTLTKPFAIDLESKLAESALANVEIADYRQFAHGRHLRLVNISKAPLIISVNSYTGENIATETLKLVPAGVPVAVFRVSGQTPQEILITSLLMASFATESIAKASDVDPGQPTIPQFGRDIHKLDPSKDLHSDICIEDAHGLAAYRKIGRTTSNSEQFSKVVDASHRYYSKLCSASIKAIVSDFDGTLCNTEGRYDGMCPEIREELSRLLREGITLVVASGRGDSLQRCLRQAIDTKYHDSIWVGYYGGSVIEKLNVDVQPPPANIGFQEIYEWLNSIAIYHSKRPLEDMAKGGQFTIRLESNAQAQKLLMAIRSWFIDTDKIGWRVFSSGHSVDVLDSNTSKRNVIEFVAENFNLCPKSEILRLGDSGHEEGNDFELLSGGLSLSADKVTSSLLSCWNYAPPGNRQARATLSYLKHLTKFKDGHRISQLI
ncbi:HAD hydrolase family protein [Spartinivicinus poritis]|uniref:HAD hydrolase family protein n=1 Tax=Spartinivicinus poritis TaxID=2994640 RepID=A0ABT5UH05_9GAMM|nr:HAD hydrolase family protein [Spartinivicinus sp. A2-2]MDE1464772.1 HAD hydrolase family protein [Spartinivicinus sp. A2-2]